METVEYAAGRLADVVGRPFATDGSAVARAAGRRTLIGPAACRVAVRPRLGRGRSGLEFLRGRRRARRSAELGAVHPRAGRRPRRCGARRLVDGWRGGGGADDSGATVRRARSRTPSAWPARSWWPTRSPVASRRPNCAVMRHAPRSPCCTAYRIASSLSRWPTISPSALRHNDWPVEVVELPADHGSIAGAVYDAAAGRYSAATDSKTLAVAADVAAHIADASRSRR